ncbi:MAG TPA: hypothetical protein VFY72_01390, partial [Beijerinckiaceae bacterium]|nr:hypothetical protein [Beijerinckiaceae bacterium]
CPKSLHADLIRVWVHPRIKSEDMLFGSMRRSAADSPARLDDPAAPTLALDDGAATIAIIPTIAAIPTVAPVTIGVDSDAAGSDADVRLGGRLRRDPRRDGQSRRGGDDDAFHEALRS